MVVPGATRSLMFMCSTNPWAIPAWYFSARLWNQAGGARGLLSIRLASVQVFMGMYALVLDLRRAFRAMGLDIGDVDQGHLLAERSEERLNGRFAAGERAVRNLGLDLP